MQAPQEFAEGFLMIMRPVDAIIYIRIGFVNEENSYLENGGALLSLLSRAV